MSRLGFRGRGCIKPEGDYLPVRVAAQKAGYTTRHVNYLVKMGSITAKKAKGGILVYYPSLLNIPLTNLTTQG
jgi:hypothetical protein